MVRSEKTLSQLIRFTKVLQSKFDIKILLSSLSALLPISIYLSLFSKNASFWIFVSFISFIPLLFNYKYLIISILVITLALFVHYLTKPNLLEGNLDGNYRIIKITSMGPIIKQDNELIFLKTRDQFSVGDIIKVSGEIKKIVNDSDFDKETYFKTLNVINYIERPKISLLGTSNDIRDSIYSFITNSSGDYKKVTPLLLIGLKTKESKEIYQTAIRMNIVHLFVISGFHISLFFVITTKLLNLMKIKESISMWIALVPVIIYLFILNFPISATRAVLLVICMVINKNLLNKRFDSIQILSFVMSVMFISSPRSIYSLSFIFTFIATYVVIMINYIKFESNTNKYIVMSIMAFCSNLVIVLYQNHFFSIFGLFYGSLLSPVFVLIYSLTLFLFPFKEIMGYIDYVFVLILKIFENTNIVIDLPRFSIQWVFLSYGIILSSLIIWLVWNLFMEKKGFLLTKNLIEQ